MAETKTKTKSSAVIEAIINDAPRLHESFEIGDVAHQGDLILIRIAQLPRSAKPRANRQLAIGNTQGARHVLERGECYDCDPREAASLIKEATGTAVSENFIGPVFVSPENPSEHDLSHPEHGDQGFPAGACIAVVYQRNLDDEEREARVRD